MGNANRARRKHRAARAAATAFDAHRGRINALAPAAERAADARSAGGSHTWASASAVPEAVRRRFIAARNVYYFLGGGRAFMDRGDQLTTRSENNAVIGSLIEIAQARGWREIALSGTERFRRQAWLAARLANLTVRGVTPDAQLRAQLTRARARRARRAASASVDTPPSVPGRRAAPRSTPSAQRLDEWHGRLIEHGAATDRHRLASSTSYFVTLATPDGETTLWGVDLKRALQAAASRPQPGDEVVVARVGHEAVRGRAHGAESNEMKRHRYAIETRERWDAQARIAHLVRDPSVSAAAGTQRYPQLASTYLQLHAAALAAQRLSHEADRTRFVQLVRGALADSIAHGEALRSVRLRSHADARVAPAAPLARG